MKDLTLDDCEQFLNDIGFIHDPPKGYTYEVRKKGSLVSIWTVSNPGFIFNNGGTVRCIWGFYNPKRKCYHAPINSTKHGDKVDIKSTTPYSAMQLNLNPLEYALFSAS